MPTIRKTALLFLALLVLLTGCTGKPEVPAAADTTEAIETTEAVPAQPEGAMRSGLQTMIIVSLKEFQPDSGYRNPHQADLMMLMLLDADRGTAASLQLNPDTLVSFTPQGTHDALEIPLGQAFSYGSGGSDSCLNLTKAVSRLLGGITVHNYLFFTQDAVTTVNDLIGGVDVTVTDAFPAQYPELAPGEVHLMGSTMFNYFDYRAPSDSDNSGHMARQQQYMIKAFPIFVRKMQEDSFPLKLSMQLGDQMDTDLTLSQMVQTMEFIGGLKLDTTIHTLPGSFDGTGFRIDAAAAQKIIEQLFF